MLPLLWLSCVSKGALLHFEMFGDMVQRNVQLFLGHFFNFSKTKVKFHKDTFEEICHYYLLVFEKICNIRLGLKGNASKFGACFLLHK